MSDIALTPASIGHIEVRAAAVRGWQHRATGEPRQDVFALGVADEQDLIAVVCDGVGTFRQSHVAASLTAWRLTELARQGESWAPAFTTVNDELHAQAWDGLGTDHAKLTMATTVLAVRLRAAPARSDGPAWHGQAAWVGDSPMWHLTGDGRWTGCTHPGLDQGEDFRPTWSSSLPDPNLRVAEMELEFDDGALFLMSDGVGVPLASADEVRTTLARWWATPPDIFDFGRQVGFARDTYVDDRTVVGLWLGQ